MVRRVGTGEGMGEADKEKRKHGTLYCDDVALFALANYKDVTSPSTSLLH